MRKKALRSILILLAFTLEITIKAEIIKSPEGCSGFDGPCVLKNISSKAKNYNFDNLNIRLNSNSMMRIDNAEIKLLKGQFLIECLLTCLMSSLQIESIQANKGSFYIDASLNKSEILGLSGEVVHRISGQGRFVLLPAMMQIVESGNLQGKKTELPLVMDDNYLFKKLSPLTVEIDRLVKNLSASRVNSIQSIAEMNKNIIERKISNHKEKVRSKKASKKNYNDESHRLRLLFKRKNSL